MYAVVFINADCSVWQLWRWIDYERGRDYNSKDKTGWLNRFARLHNNEQISMSMYDTQ